MSGVIHWAIALVSTYFAWRMRKRNIGMAIMSMCIGGLAGLSMGDIVVEGRKIGGFAEFLKVSITGGLPSLVTSIVAWLFMLGFVVGLVLTVVIYRREAREADNKRIAVVELRGLVDTSDTPLISAIPSRFVGRREDCRIDLRSMVSSKSLDVPAALREMENLPRNLRQRRADTARADVQVVAGGVMQVPLLFYAGMLLDDEGRVTLMDWDRIKEQWRELTDVDSGVRFQVDYLDSVQPNDEVVLAVSASYKAELADIAATFPGPPMVHLYRPNPRVNALWSEDEQGALTQQFLDVLSDLQNRGVTLVHLILAAPASLSIRFGRAYDARNMPPLRCYHWEKGQTTPYPWSVQMPLTLGASAIQLPTESQIAKA
ncbi:SAVED domain-containing protein [Pseudomonas sp. TAF7]|uniref:SAVED domain-containing protein n=1 Tax=Pseudomonas sp. TAF7 TaxID=3233073 RepID=UPI003F9B79B6